MFVDPNTGTPDHLMHNILDYLLSLVVPFWIFHRNKVFKRRAWSPAKIRKLDMSRSPINFNYGAGVPFEIQSPAAFYHDAATISGSMHEFTFPLSSSDELGIYFFQWYWEFRLQKTVAESAYDFLLSPAIKLLGAAVPKVNSTLNRASHNAIVYEIKIILMVALVLLPVCAGLPAVTQAEYSKIVLQTHRQVSNIFMCCEIGVIA
jgi:hypothetical protein